MPPLPQSPGAGDELRIGSRVFRITETIKCAFSQDSPHYDVAVDEVQTSGTKAAALDELYSRITRIAKEMGGTASPRTSTVGFSAASVPSSRSEDAPALRVLMSDGFQVDFAPLQPLRIGNALSVRATRTTPQGRLTDWSWNLGLDGSWQGAKGPLTDKEIRDCLTPKGPPPLY